MNSRAQPGSPLGRRSLAPTLLVVGGLFVLTWLTVIRPSAPVLAHDPRLQLVLSALSAVALALGAALFWSRGLSGGAWQDWLNGFGLAMLAGASAAVVAAGVQPGAASHTASLAAAWGAGELIAAPAFLLARRLVPSVRLGRPAVALIMLAPVVYIGAAVLAVNAVAGDSTRVAGALLGVAAAVIFFAAGTGLRREGDVARPDNGSLFSFALYAAGFNALQYAVFAVSPANLQPADLVRCVIAVALAAVSAAAIVRAAGQLAAVRRELEALRSLGRPFDDPGLAAAASRIGRIAGAVVGADVRVELSGNVDPVEEPDAFQSSTAASVARVAIRTPHRYLGALVASRSPGDPFSPEDLTLLESCAALAALSIDRSLLQEEVAATAVLEERSRLAREVHDGLAQHLAFLKMRVAWLRRSGRLDADQLGEMEHVLESALSDAREAITTLRTEPRGSVADAIAEYASGFGQVSGLSLQVVHDASLPDVGPRVRVELLRIVQEALNNARKHANAGHVEVQIRGRGRGVEVTIRDDGSGFEPKRGAPGHFGLEIMRERARSVGGHLDVASAPGSGTTVRVWIPAIEPRREGETGDLDLAHG